MLQNCYKNKKEKEIKQKALMLLLVYTFATLNSRQVCQLVFPTFYNALSAYLYLWQFETQPLAINPFNPGIKAMNRRWTTLTLFRVCVMFP